MKRTRLTRLLIILMIIVVPSFDIQAQSIRQKININREWKFLLADEKGAAANAYNDSKWSNINIPHNFSIPYFQAATWYTGYGWYRKHFHVPAGGKGKRMFIEFEGAFREAEVFVNGQKVGASQSGYTGFSFDITHAILPGDNILAVRLNNNWNAQMAPLNGDHTFTGGIYRDVYLVLTNTTHVAWYGTFVTTPQVSNEAATVKMTTEIRNDSKQAKLVNLKTTIIDPSGKTVDSFSSSKKIEAGANLEFEQTGNTIAQPKLWNPKHPYM